MSTDTFLLDFYTPHNQGFGHSLMSFCRAVEFARSNNMIFTIDDSRWFLGRWADYFINNFQPIEQINPDRIYKKNIGQKQFDEDAYAQFKKLDVQVKHAEEYNYFLDPNILSILKEYYVYQPHFSQIVERTCENYDFEKLVSFHIRLGDKIAQHEMDLTYHLNLIEKLIDKYKVGECDYFLMTDDLSIRDDVSKVLGKEVQFRQIPPVKPKLLRFQKGHLGDLLIEVEIAMRSKTFFSSISDTSRLVRAYRAIHGKSSPIDFLPI